MKHQEIKKSADIKTVAREGNVIPCVWQVNMISIRKYFLHTPYQASVKDLLR